MLGQLLLPIVLEVNEETKFLSYIIDSAAGFGIIYLLIGAAVSAYHGKRGWSCELQ